MGLQTNRPVLFKAAAVLRVAKVIEFVVLV